jgi:hypothetical protein
VTSFQWFLLGGMVALSPSFIVLALALWREAQGPEEHR